MCVCVSMCPELLAPSEPQENANYTETQVITTVTPGKPLSQRFDLFQRNQNKIKPHPCKQKSCQTKPNQNKTKKITLAWREKRSSQMLRRPRLSKNKHLALKPLPKDSWPSGNVDVKFYCLRIKGCSFLVRCLHHSLAMLSRAVTEKLAVRCRDGS